MGSRQDAKHEKFLKGLVKLSDNKQCANCGTLGPQYIVMDFYIYVCTVCSGVHRQFHHRCKGISMATFKPEEIKAIENGGNAAALAQYLAKWTPRDLAKPIDRRPEQIRDWIDAVYKQKRFFDPAGHTVPPHAVMRTSSFASGRDDIPSKSVSELLGGETLKLQVSLPIGAVNPPLASGALNQSFTPSASSLDGKSGSASPATFRGEMVHVPAHAPTPGVNGNSWAAFDEPPTAGPGPSSQNEMAAAPSNTWAAFDTALVQAPAQTPAPSPAPSSQLPPKAAAGSVGPGWDAFDSGPGANSVAGATSNASAVLAPEPVKPAMKELPSDLFSDFPMAMPQPHYGHPAARPPAVYGGLPGPYPTMPGYPPPYGAAPQQPSAFSTGVQPGYGPAPPGYQQQAPNYNQGGNHQTRGQPSYGTAGGYPGGPQAPGPDPFLPKGLANGSLPAADSGFGAPPFAGVSNDPFSGLVPGFRSALPQLVEAVAPIQVAPAPVPSHVGRATTPSMSPQSSISSTSWATGSRNPPQPPATPTREYSAPHPLPQAYSSSTHAPGPTASALGQGSQGFGLASDPPAAWQNFDGAFGGGDNSFGLPNHTTSFPTSGVSAFASHDAQSRMSLDQPAPSAIKSGNPFA